MYTHISIYTCINVYVHIDMYIRICIYAYVYEKFSKENLLLDLLMKIAEELIFENFHERLDVLMCSA